MTGSATSLIDSGTVPCLALYADAYKAETMTMSYPWGYSSHPKISLEKVGSSSPGISTVSIWAFSAPEVGIVFTTSPPTNFRMVGLYEVKSKTTQDTKLGENGTVQVTQQTIAKTDISDLFNKALQLELEKERKNNAIEIGLGYHNDWYVPISYQHNIGKNKAIEVEIHKELKFNTNITGGEVKTVIKF